MTRRRWKRLVRSNDERFRKQSDTARESCNDGAAFLRCKNAATLHRPTFEQKLQVATRTHVMLGDGTN